MDRRATGRKSLPLCCDSDAPRAVVATASLYNAVWQSRQTCTAPPFAPFPSAAP